MLPEDVQLSGVCLRLIACGKENTVSPPELQQLRTFLVAKKK